MIKLCFNTSKNLLAFSAGIDSTALFFILLENNIPFDIAIVDYNLREQSKKEVLYAKNLAKEYNKKCFLKEVNLSSFSNVEKKARDVRYAFFEDIIQKNSYERLFTAHQLNDKLEWFLMQLSKGAGLAEILGLKENELKENYYLTRPLLQYTKESLQNYLNEKNEKYFIDESNTELKYTRNIIRKNFSNDFIKDYQDGVKKSFLYLEKDYKSLNINKKALVEIKELEIFKNLQDDNLNIRIIDFSMKKRGFLLSSKQRDQILKQKELVVSHKISICITKELIYISPKENCTMDKKFKEKCRLNKIPKYIREYINKENINLNLLRI